jgi:type IV pilus assembly protein PilC
MVKAGEMGGALDVTLRRLAEFVEKAQRIKGKVRSAMFYPAAVLIVAGLILVLLTTFVIPRFKEVFAGLVPGAQLPAFTSFVLGISDAVRHHLLLSMLASFGVGVAAAAALRTTWGRWTFDRLKLSLPAVGPVIRKTSISRFARTLGTLLGNGVPILPALTIVRETAGNVVVSRVVSAVQDSVKEGETVAAPLRASGVFPPVICGMVDVGEQTGALPDMLMKIADGCDDEVDNAVNAMTSLLEPILIIFLAVVVGSIVIALFLPILTLINSDGMGLPDGADS